MNCIRMPTSLADAESIIELCGGPNWRDNFLLGLLVVLVVGVLVAPVIVTIMRHR